MLYDENINQQLLKYLIKKKFLNFIKLQLLQIKAEVYEIHNSLKINYLTDKKIN